MGSMAGMATARAQKVLKKGEAVAGQVGARFRQVTGIRLGLTLKASGYLCGLFGAAFIGTQAVLDEYLEILCLQGRIFKSRCRLFLRPP